MQFDFSKDQVQAEAWMTVHDLSTRPRLKLRQATKENPKYYGAMMRKVGDDVLNRYARTRKTSPDDESLMSDVDRELFPRYVLVDWEGVVDVNKELVPCTIENKQAFFAQIPNWIWERIRMFARTPENFLPEEDAVDPDPGAIAGN